MLNIWCGVNPARLKDDWLVKEHVELHEVIRILNDEESVDAFPEAIWFLGRTGYLKRRHDLVAKEMSKRGMAHHTPITISDVPEEDEWTNHPGERVKSVVEKLEAENAFNDLEDPLTF